MRLNKIILCIMVIVKLNAQAEISQKEAFVLGARAYLYAYPLVLTQVTRKIMTNVAQPDAEHGRAPINQFFHATKFPDPEFNDIVRPNVDTLYSMAWLDLSKEPMILSVPDTKGRYYVMEMLDAWTNVFAAPGKRTTGTKAQNFAIVGPKWKGSLPKDVKKIVAPTDIVWIIGRTQTNGIDDYENVHEIQEGYKLTPLQLWGKKYRAPLARVNPNLDMEIAPVDRVEKMDAEEFFTIFAHALKKNPPAKEDAPMIAALEKIGIIPGEDFDNESASPEVMEQLNKAIEYVHKKFNEQDIHAGDLIHGWHIIKTNIGTYGTHYNQRALVAFKGVGANLAEDAIYPTAFVDCKGQALNGRNHYKIHFHKEELPPVNAFWSVTMYNNESFLVPNSIDRYALGDRNRLKYNEDGSLDIYISHDDPHDDRESNWLPAPEGQFNLSMRLYWPKSSVLDGTWQPPGIKRIEE